MGLELDLDQLRQVGPGGHRCLVDEGGGVLLHQAVQRGLVRAVRLPVDRGAIRRPPGVPADGLHEGLWELDQAQSLSCAALMCVSQVHTQHLQHLLGPFERFDLLELPVAQVWPFPLAQACPKQIAGRNMDTDHRWMECMLYASFAGLPAISVPAGFGGRGRWPMGLQLIGRPQGDVELLRAAAGYESLSANLPARPPAKPAV